MPVALAGWALTLIDRVILARYVSLADVGFYGIANRVAYLLFLVVGGFGAAWGPFILRLHQENESEAREARGRVLHVWVAGLVVVAAFLSGLAPELVEVIAGRTFLPAADIIPVLVLSLVLIGTGTITGTTLMIAKRSGELAVSAGIATATNVAACFVLIPRYGVQGAAVATLLSSVVSAGVMYWRAQVRLEAPFQWARTAAILLVFLPYGALGWVHGSSLLLSVVGKSLAIATLPVILVLLRFVPREDVRRLIDALRTRRAPNDSDDRT
jgi:O-antigen/teichoic acid export membrane protein